MQVANGAYSTYTNGTAAQSLWIEGGVAPYEISYVVSTFGLAARNHIIAGNNVTEFEVNNNTSMCVFYQGGWTKVYTYMNNSLGGSCLGFVNANFKPVISNQLVSLLKGNQTLTNFKNTFFYTNSSNIGYSLWKSNGTFGFSDISQNSHGSFISYVDQFANSSATAKLNNRCYGLLYENNGISVCSTYTFPVSGANSIANFSMINSTELTGSYKLGIYSIVNSSAIVESHYNAIQLIKALKVNQSALPWKNVYQNNCGLASTPISCAVANFTYSTNTALVNITNNYNKSIEITRASCYMPGEQANYTFNTTVGPGGSNTIMLPCHNVPIPLASAIYSYTFTMNYTIRNASKLAVGYLNITNYPTET